MVFNNSICYHQSETIPFLFCCVKWLSEVVDLLGRNALPLIANSDDNIVILFYAGYKYRAASLFLHGFYRVFQEIEEGFFQLVFITVGKKGVTFVIHLDGYPPFESF
ncbi:hypothetical protein D3C84_1113540 [compost metagenome]